MEVKNDPVFGNHKVKDTMARAEQVTVTEFSAALSSGILAALDARRIKPGEGVIDWNRWIWAGWIIGDGPRGPGDPFPGTGPIGSDTPAE